MDTLKESSYLGKVGKYTSQNSVSVHRKISPWILLAARSPMMSIKQAHAAQSPWKYGSIPELLLSLTGMIRVRTGFKKTCKVYVFWRHKLSLRVVLLGQRRGAPFVQPNELGFIERIRNRTAHLWKPHTAINRLIYNSASRHEAAHDWHTWRYGVGAVLIFIGLKLIASSWFEA